MRDGGLEPLLLAEPDPKSGAATNYANRAFQGAVVVWGGQPSAVWGVPLWVGGIVRCY